MTIFLLAVLVTRLSAASPFSGLATFQLPSKLALRSLLWVLILTGAPILEGPEWFEMLFYLSFYFLQFFFWFLVLTTGWWVIKKFKK